MAFLSIRDLTATVYDTTSEKEKEILKGVNLDIQGGTTHVLMGTNGSGKSTLAHILMGHPSYKVTGGSIDFEGQDLLRMAPDDRARNGLFLAFQYPPSIPGLPVATFLKRAAESSRGSEISVREFQRELRGHMKELQIPQSFLGRFINEGFSGGEKKRMEVLQLNLLDPKLVILDETDSGLDIDALKLLFKNIAARIRGGRSLLVISHYERVFDYINPDFVHIMKDGEIVRSGGPELGRSIHSEGFESAIAEASAGVMYGK